MATAMNFGEVQYRNMFYQPDAVVTVDPNQSTANDQQRFNAYDWFDWSLYAPTSTDPADLYISVELPRSTVVSRFSLYFSTLDSTTDFFCEIETGSGTGVFDVVATINVQALPIADSIIYTAEIPPRVVPSGAQVRIRWAPVNVVFRQIYAGDHLDFAIGQYQSLKPLTLSPRVVVSNNISVNGSLLSRDVRQRVREDEIMLDPVDPDWVRNEWVPFAAAASLHSFFWRWNPKGRPGDIVMSAAQSIVDPVNSSPSPKMMVRMPVRSTL